MSIASKVYEFNKVYFEDCIEAMKEFDDNSIDLCITDPPYNVGLVGNSQVRYSDIRSEKDNWKTQEKLSYYDNIPDYARWSLSWFSEALRACRRLIFTPGNPNLKMWYELTEPVDIMFHYKPNGFGRTANCLFNKGEVLLLYGDWKGVQFLQNVFIGEYQRNPCPRECMSIKVPLTNGFLRTDEFIHPCPKNVTLWETIIKEAKCETVLDPFMGSGTTAEACEFLGKDWIGFELRKEYEVDIEKRIATGRNRKATRRPVTEQQSLEF